MDPIAAPFDLQPLLWGAMGSEPSVLSAPPSPLDPLTPSPMAEAAGPGLEPPPLELPPPLTAAVPSCLPPLAAVDPQPPGSAPPRTHAQKGHTKRRRAKRKAARELFVHAPTRPSLSEKHKLPGKHSVAFRADRFSATKPGYVGLFLGKAALQLKPSTLQGLLDSGYELIEWDGRCVLGPFRPSLQP